MSKYSCTYPFLLIFCKWLEYILSQQLKAFQRFDSGINIIHLLIGLKILKMKKKWKTI